MRINRLSIPEKICNDKGIKKIDINRMSAVVALVGKNGSGKTRILDLIQENLASIISINRFLDNSISFPPNNLVSHLRVLVEFKEFLLLQEQILTIEKN